MKIIITLVLIKLFNIFFRIFFQIFFWVIFYKFCLIFHKLLNKKLTLYNKVFENKKIITLIAIILDFIIFSFLHIVLYYFLKTNIVLLSYILTIISYIFNVIRYKNVSK